MRSNLEGIPKVIHFIWVSPYLQENARLPFSVQSNILMWKQLHSDYEVKLWDTEMVKEELRKENRAILMKLKKWDACAGISDILRYPDEYFKFFLCLCSVRQSGQIQYWYAQQKFL